MGAEILKLRNRDMRFSSFTVDVGHLLLHGVVVLTWERIWWEEFVGKFSVEIMSTIVVLLGTFHTIC